MSEIKFLIQKTTDRSLVDSLSRIASDCNSKDNSQIRLEFAPDHQHPIVTNWSAISSNEHLQKILATDSAVFSKISVTLSALANSTIRIERDEAFDRVVVFFNNVQGPEVPSMLLSSAHRHLPVYGRTENIDKLLGQELSEFYRRREEGLLRLEALTQKLIEDNERYRSQLDVEVHKKKEVLETETKRTRESLDEEFKKRAQTLSDKETQLAERSNILDDRDSKHARRQLRKDLKDALASRATEFTLTKRTNQKRWPIHSIFLALLGIIGASIYVSFNAVPVWVPLKEGESAVRYYVPSIRLLLSTLAFIAMAIYYIRWNDLWFRQHADEEFRLKRMDLDIDRASWIVEMALEFKDEEGREIPQELINRLSANLFQSSDDYPSSKHPAEDISNALLSASSGISLRVPRFGEISIDRKGVSRLKKELEKTES